jgi:hypothetical protein
VPELEIDIGAQLVASLDNLTTALRKENAWRQRQAQVIRQVPIKPPQANAAGVIDVPQAMSAPTGYYWGIRRLTLSGFTAGSAVIYLNGLGGATVGEPIPFDQAGMFTFGRGELLLHPGDRLVVNATGTNGYVQLDGAADCFEQWYLPYYLG